MRRTEFYFLQWVLLTLFFALILGGIPWKFPKNGAYWIENWKAQFNLK